MASILPVGSRWRAQVRKRGQSIAKTFKTESAAEAWAREREAEIDKGHNAVDAATGPWANSSGREERTVEAGESGRIIKVEAAAVVAVIQPA